MAPFLIDDPKVGELFPSDAIERAKTILSYFGGRGLGAYTDSKGAPGIRDEIAEFIERRDGYPADPMVCPPVSHLLLFESFANL